MFWTFSKPMDAFKIVYQEEHQIWIVLRKSDERRSMASFVATKNDKKEEGVYRITNMTHSLRHKEKWRPLFVDPIGWHLHYSQTHTFANLLKKLKRGKVKPWWTMYESYKNMTSVHCTIDEQVRFRDKRGKAKSRWDGGTNRIKNMARFGW